MTKISLSKFRIQSGPLFVAAAAFLWGTDALFRYPLAGKLDPKVLVFFEHCFGFLFILFGMLFSFPVSTLVKKLKLNRKEFFSAFIVGVLGSASATVLFSASFQLINPSVAILLQKFQPIFVLAFAYFILKEVPAKNFFGWAALALASGTVLSFPDFNFHISTVNQKDHYWGVAYALLASLLWAISTVWGKLLLNSKPILVALFWRYALGFLTLGAILILSGTSFDVSTVTQGVNFRSIWYLSVLSGIIPLLLYYKGLSHTRAVVTTFVELLYSVSAIILNQFLLDAPLSFVQLIASIVLLFAVTRISV